MQGWPLCRQTAARVNLCAAAWGGTEEAVQEPAPADHLLADARSSCTRFARPLHAVRTAAQETLRISEETVRMQQKALRATEGAVRQAEGDLRTSAQGVRTYAKALRSRTDQEAVHSTMQTDLRSREGVVRAAQEAVHSARAMQSDLRSGEGIAQEALPRAETDLRSIGRDVRIPEEVLRPAA